MVLWRRCWSRPFSGPAVLGKGPARSIIIHGAAGSTFTWEHNKDAVATGPDGKPRRIPPQVAEIAHKIHEALLAHDARMGEGWPAHLQRPSAGGVEFGRPANFEIEVDLKAGTVTGFENTRGQRWSHERPHLRAYPGGSRLMGTSERKQTPWGSLAGERVAQAIGLKAVYPERARVGPNTEIR